MDSKICLCRGVLLQNAVRITKTYKNHPANVKKIENTGPNLLGDIWKGTRSILQNMCARVYYYKMQCTYVRITKTIQQM